MISDAGEFLAIHGMPGSGKSVLAAEAIRDPEITLKYFPDGVFWFRVGMLDPEKLLNRIKILLEKLNTPQVRQLYIYSCDTHSKLRISHVRWVVEFLARGYQITKLARCYQKIEPIKRKCSIDIAYYEAIEI